MPLDYQLQIQVLGISKIYLQFYIYIFFCYLKHKFKYSDLKDIFF